MKKIFKSIKPIDFDAYFSSDEKCLEILAEEKWGNGYKCRKCGHDNYCKGPTPFSRRCTKCKSTESATAHTIFHKCKISISNAFKIAYTVCYQPDTSSYKMADMTQIRHMTCYNLQKKLKECLEEKGGDIIL